MVAVGRRGGCALPGWTCRVRPESEVTCARCQHPTEITEMTLSHLLEIKSDKMELSRSTRLDVFKYFWYMGSNSDHGSVIAKKSRSLRRASSQVMPYLISLELGYLTQYQLLSRGSFSLRMKGSHADSSPVGMRSGLVRTPANFSTGVQDMWL